MKSVSKCQNVSSCLFQKYDEDLRMTTSCTSPTFLPSNITTSDTDECHVRHLTIHKSTVELILTRTPTILPTCVLHHPYQVNLLIKTRKLKLQGRCENCDNSKRIEGLQL